MGYLKGQEVLLLFAAEMGGQASRWELGSGLQPLLSWKCWMFLERNLIHIEELRTVWGAGEAGLLSGLCSLVFQGNS